MDPVLTACTHVFVRHDEVCSPLQPYEVIKRQGKSYTLLIKGHERAVSLDRLKPAHMEQTLTNDNPQPMEPQPSNLIPSHTTPFYTTCYLLWKTCSLATPSQRLHILVPSFIPSLEGEYCSELMTLYPLHMMILSACHVLSLIDIIFSHLARSPIPKIQFSYTSIHALYYSM